MILRMQFVLTLNCRLQLLYLCRLDGYVAWNLGSVRIHGYDGEMGQPTLKVSNKRCLVSSCIHLLHLQLSLSKRKEQAMYVVYILAHLSHMFGL